MISQQSASTQLNTESKITPPGPLPLPFVGMLTFLKKFPHLELNRLAKKYGNIFQIRVGARTFVVLSGLETLKEALVKQEDIFNARADFDVYQQPPQCYFIEKKSGEPWHKHRSIVGQVMHSFMTSNPGILESWALEEGADLANIFANSGGQPFDPNLYLPLAYLSFIQRLLFNKKGNLNDPEEDPDFFASAYVWSSVNEGGANLTKLEIAPAILRPILVITLLRKPLQNFVKAITVAERYFSKNLEQHRESFDPENLRDITDGLLKASSELTESDRNDLELSEKDIVDGSLTQFLGAGTELPNLMLKWALLYMIRYPDIQAEVHKELDEVVGRKQQPTLEHRGKLPFTEACIHEIFRHSSATVGASFVYGTAADTTLNGYFIPKNTPIFPNYYGLTRDERYWEEPEQFNPYRFLDENGKLRKNLLDKFYPFGMGSRRCIGEHIARLLIFTFFTNIMHRCKLEKVSGEKLSFVPQSAVMLPPKNYTLVAKPRF